MRALALFSADGPPDPPPRIRVLSLTCLCLHQHDALMTLAPTSPRTPHGEGAPSIELDDMSNPIQGHVGSNDGANQPLIAVPSSSHHDEARLSNGDTQYEENITGSGGNIFLYTLTLSACLSGLLFGYDTGVISSTLVSIGTDLSDRRLTNLDKGLITSCTSFFALLASPLAGWLADRWWGRKGVIVLADVLFVGGALWQAGAGTVGGLVGGRGVVGLGIGGASLVTPLYISELAPSHLRGRLVTVSLLFITGGQVVAYVVGWMFSTMPGGWRWMVGLGALPALLQIVLLVFMPETPRYLCKVGREEEARAVLVKVYRGISGEPEKAAASVVRAINQEINEEAESRLLVGKDRRGSSRLVLPTALSSLLFHPPHRRALAITCMLQGLQQLCGFNSLMYFSATIFDSLHFSSPTLTSLSIAVTNFLFTVAAFYLIDRIGRRRILLLTIPVMVIALLLCAASFTFLDVAQSPASQTDGDPTQSSRGPALAILASLLLYVSAYATGLGPVPWQQSELFPLSVRSLGSSLATAANWGSNTIVGLTFLPMMQWLTPGWTFVCYAVVCAGGWLVVRRIYPETMGLSLEEVGKLLSEDWGVKQKASAARREAAD